jgi:hypothetical protein
MTGAKMISVWARSCGLGFETLRGQVGKNMKIDEAKAVFLDLLNSLESMPVNPWPFLCASALIDYLTKMVHGGESGAEKYKQFVSTYLARVNPLYNSFTYIYGSPSPKQDLPLQMYHILRCGIVHSFSFIPDNQAAAKGGRPRSVLIAHEGVHLSAYRDNGQDAALFVLHDFVIDLKKVIEQIFLNAATDHQLRNNIEQHLQQNPPIIGRFP